MQKYTHYSKDKNSATIRYINVFSFIYILAMIIFGNNTNEVNPILAQIERTLAVVATLNLLYLYYSNNTKIPATVLLLVIAIVLLAIYIDGGIADTGNVWLTIFPLVAYYLKGERYGTYWVIVFSIVIIAIDILILKNLIHSDFSPLYLRQTFLVYFIVLLLSYSNERIKRMTTSHVLKSQRELSSIFENMQDTFFRTDNESTIIDITPSIEKLLGYTSDEIIGKKLSDFFKHHNDTLRFLRALKYNKGKITDFEIPLIHKDNHTVWILANTQYFYDDRGEISGIEGSTKDITTLKSTQEDLLRLNQNLEQNIAKRVDELRNKDAMMLQQARLAQMGEMLSMIAHQWRQPLSSIAAINGNIKLDIAIEGEVKVDTLQSEIEKIDAHVNYLSNTIEDFRNFFNPGNKAQEFELNEIIEKALQVLSNNIQKNNITIEENLEDSLNLLSHKNELIQVIINIINNAIDALNENNTDSEKIIHIDTYKTQEVAIINIYDNAGGIPEHIIPKIFDPYFSTKDAKNGTGLGLYMSKMIIEDHCQGELIVKNFNKGAHFVISLPNQF